MSVPAKRYEGAEPYVFISYSHADSERVLAIVKAMEKRGYRVWYDAGINAGQQWTETRHLQQSMPNRKYRCFKVHHHPEQKTTSLIVR